MRRGRIHLKKHRKYGKLTKFFVLFFCVFLTALFLVHLISKNFTPSLQDYSVMETKKFATLVINKSLSKQMAEGMTVDNLFTVVQNNEGEIQTVDFNSTVVNKVLSTTTNLIQLNLKAIEEGNVKMVELPENVLVDYDKKNLAEGIIFRVPIWSVTNNVFLSNLGPKVPVRFKVLSNVLTSFKTNIKEYGINNAMIEVLIHVEVNIRMILPITSKEVTVKNDIPVAMKVVQGKIPEYYQNGYSKNSSAFSIPLE